MNTNWKRLRTLPVILLSLALLPGQGCYRYRISATVPAVTQYEKKTIHCFLWGLVQPREVRVNSDERGAGLAEVVILNNFGNAAITTLTLGIWCPVRIKWQLSSPCPTVENKMSPLPK